MQGLPLGQARVLEGAGPGWGLRLAGGGGASRGGRERDAYEGKSLAYCHPSGSVPPGTLKSTNQSETWGRGSQCRRALHSQPRRPAARDSPRPTEQRGASCQPWCAPVGPWRRSTCTGRWADPCAGPGGLSVTRLLPRQRPAADRQTHRDPCISEGAHWPRSGTTTRVTPPHEGAWTAAHRGLWPLRGLEAHLAFHPHPPIHGSVWRRAKADVRHFVTHLCLANFMPLSR